MNAILFAKDGSISSVKDLVPSTYLNEPVYVAPNEYPAWHNGGPFPCNLTSYARRRYVKQMESEDYAVFVEE